jgi:hypothetical protein
MLSSSPKRSVFDHPVEVPKMVKLDQCFLKTLSRANRTLTLTYEGLDLSSIFLDLLLLQSLLLGELLKYLLSDRPF